MSLSITIELSDKDLELFRDAQKASEMRVGDRPESEVLEAATQLLAIAQKTQVPDFIRDRLDRLDALVAMLRDEGWSMPDADRKHVMSAMVYFSDPVDIIPDDVPVLGYLDDAIMIELCVVELRHELDAYDDFCEFRQREAERRGLNPAEVGRADWLDERRDELLDRMHKRREGDAGFGTGYGRSSGYGRKSYTQAWRPSMFSMR
jgi:uncharacterized membrane protein YkvA (DUF1232 family)